MTGYTIVLKSHDLIHPYYFPIFILISFLIVLCITVVVIYVIKMHSKGSGHIRHIFLDVIRDGDYYPSLPRFQFLIWTFVISFTYLSVYLIRLYSIEFDAVFVDPNLLILLGISISSPIISNIISGYKYSRRLTREEYENSYKRFQDRENEDENNFEDRSFRTMLFENHKPALFRYQMFLWTFVGVFIYLSAFSSGVYVYSHDFLACLEKQQTEELKCNAVESLELPKIDYMLVVLMGLSQSGYLGGKVVARTPSRIKKLIPGTNGKFIILGFNFGEKNGSISSGTILINGTAIAGHTDSNVKWFDTKIEFILPPDYREKSFTLGLIIDDVIFLEKRYRYKENKRVTSADQQL